MIVFRTLILVAALGLTFPVTAAECTRQEAISAEETASTLRSWSEVHSAFVRFRHCDDGAIGEGFSESISILIAEHWDQIGILSKLSAKNRAFRQFVLYHLDETVPSDRWSVIEANASKHCPPHAASLCKSILSRSRELVANRTLRLAAARLLASTLGLHVHPNSRLSAPRSSRRPMART
jgi:hypothetical protein